MAEVRSMNISARPKENKHFSRQENLRNADEPVDCPPMMLKIELKLKVHKKLLRFKTTAAKSGWRLSEMYALIDPECC